MIFISSTEKSKGRSLPVSLFLHHSPFSHHMTQNFSENIIHNLVLHIIVVYFHYNSFSRNKLFLYIQFFRDEKLIK